MPAPKKSKDDVVKILLTVFREHGFEGASLSLLSEATGLGKSSLYHYFPKGKEDMVDAVFDAAGQILTRDVLEPLHQRGNPEDRLREALRGLSKFYDGGRAPCLVDVFSTGEGRDLFERHIQGAAHAVESGFAAVSRDSGYTKSEARQRAEDALIALQGALIVSRAKGETSPFRRVLKEFPEKLLAPATS